MGQPLNLLDDSFDGRNLIEASAGTGKTWTLTALYARMLLEKNLNVGQILVVTYTTAATAELRERIRARLAELLAIYDGNPSPDTLLNTLHQRYPQAEHHRRLRLAVQGFDESAIFTIHGFCQRALQDAAFEAGGDFDNELTQDDNELIDEILADLWRQELAKADPAWASFLAKSGITPQSLRAQLRSHLGKPYLQVEPELDPQQLPAGLQAAWQQAQRQWQQNNSAVCAELSASTVLNKNSYSPGKIQAWQRALNAYFTDFACLFDGGDALARLASAELQSKTKKGCAAPTSALSDALQGLQDQLDSAQPQAAQRLVALTAALLKALNHELPKRKAAQRILAFDDLLNQLDQGLQAEGGELLAQSLRSQYPVALIDEFQDTDPIQYSIFGSIYRDSGNLCFVGDPKQAIYAFRGADLATYLTAKEQAQCTYELDTNHRSTAELISALNGLFQHPAPFAEAKLDYPPVKAAAPRRAPLKLATEPKALNWVWLDADEQLSKGLSKAQADSMAATDTAARIAQLLADADQGRAYFDEPTGPVALKGGDIAVLVASHRQASLIAEQLALLGVPSVRRGKESVWQSEEAEAFEAVLRAYAEPSREAVLRHALLSRLLGHSAAQILAYQDNPGAWDQQRETAERYHRLWQQGFMRAFRLWLDEQGVANRLLALADGERRLTNLLHLAELVQEESLNRPAMESLLAWYSSQRARQSHGDAALLRLESDAERVQIVTIHTSKGLEYPLVFCPFLWSGRLLARQQSSVTCHTEQGQPMVDLGGPEFEQNKARARAETFAEQLRLTYVALTRARSGLWIHWGPVQQGPEYNAEDGLHTSPLAWLLHGKDCPQPDTITPQQALNRLQDTLRGQPQGLIKQALQRLIQQHPDSMALLDSLQHHSSLQRQEARAVSPAPLRHLQRPLYPAWRMGSFSGLTAELHSEAPDRDQSAPLAVQEPGSGFYAFPRGARAGVCLHAIFEDWANGKQDLAAQIPVTLTAHGIDAELWSAIAQQQIEQVLATALDGAELRLNNLSRRLPELGFTFPVARLDMTRLKTLLSDPAHQLPEAMQQAAQRLKFDTLSGFMKGFIDLTFEYQGRWYILDYKSNWLGSQASDYHPERLQQAIAAEHYYLQYLIYLVALRRFLRQRLSDFQDTDIGGAYYLFLRGMPEAGVYFQRPADSLLDALDHLFNEADR